MSLWSRFLQSSQDAAVILYKPGAPEEIKVTSLLPGIRDLKNEIIIPRDPQLISLLTRGLGVLWPVILAWIMC